MFDILIVVTNTESQAKSWQEYLETLKGTLFPLESQLFCVSENWPEGAGNGLGTLDAIEQVDSIKTQKKWLLDQIKKGKSAALFQAAGFGKRLYPMTGCEYNNKPAVKLPSSPLRSILELNLIHTRQFADRLKGRLAVFWSDQLLVPEDLPPPPSSSIELFAQGGFSVDETTWENENLANYGIVVKTPQGLCQMDKIKWPEICSLIEEGKVVKKSSISRALGSFNISPALLEGLLDLFEPYLKSRKCKLDTDPHFWMPLTLDTQTYVRLMLKKGWSEIKSLQHFEMISGLKTKLPQSNLFSIWDIGLGGAFFDFGTTHNYVGACLELLESTERSSLIKDLLGWEKHVINSEIDDCNFDQRSLASECKLSRCQVKNSVLVNVEASDCVFENVIVIQSRLSHYHATGGTLLYKVVEMNPQSLPKQGIRADYYCKKTQALLPFTTHIERESHLDWCERLPSNPMSYQELSLYNASLELQREDNQKPALEQA